MSSAGRGLSDAEGLSHYVIGLYMETIRDGKGRVRMRKRNTETKKQKRAVPTKWRHDEDAQKVQKGVIILPWVNTHLCFPRALVL